MFPRKLAIIVFISIIGLVISSCDNGTDTQQVTIPTLTTIEVTNVTSTSAITGGNIISNGGATVTARGVCWSTNSNPTTDDNTTTNGSGNDNFSCTVTGLSSNTTYYTRAYVTNNVGIGYGNIVTFTTQENSTNTLTDFDGNTYNTISIGSQIWLAENFKCTHTTVGDILNGVYTYDDNDANADLYGRLYTFQASIEACPEGWHLPTNEEFNILISLLGANAGDKLKENGSSGFNAKMSGIYNGAFGHLGEMTSFWTSTVVGDDHATVKLIINNESDTRSDNTLVNTALSVRYIRD